MSAPKRAPPTIKAAFLLMIPPPLVAQCGHYVSGLRTILSDGYVPYPMDTSRALTDRGADPIG